MPKQQFIDYKFQGGWNKDGPAELLAEDELDLADNAKLFARGGIKKRFGVEAFNSSSYGATVNQIIEWPRDDGTVTLLAMIGSDLVEPAADGTTTTVKASLSNTHIPHFFLNDKFYFIDQGSGYYVYDGTTVELVRPFMYLTSVTGTFQTAETITGGTSGATATVDIVDGDNLGVSSISGTFELSETVTGGTSGATGTIDTMDSGIDGSNDLSPIKNCEFIEIHSNSNRIFFAGNSNKKSAVYYSQYLDPAFVKSTSVVYPTRADGPVKGLEVMMDALIVGYRYSDWIWRGIDPSSDAIWEKLPTSHGPLNGDTMDVTTQSLTMVSEGGIFALNPSIIGIPMGSEVQGEYIINIAKNKVMDEIDNITDHDKVRTEFDADNGLYMIAYCDDGTGTNNKVLVFDWQLQGFTRYDGLSINDFCRRNNGDILAASENYILKLNTGTEDIDSTGAANIITFDIKTPRYDFQIPFRQKKVTRIYLSFKNFGSTHELSVDVIVDDSIEYSFTAEGDATGTEIITHREKTSLVGNNFQLEITNDQYSEVELYGIAFNYRPVRVDGENV